MTNKAILGDYCSSVDRFILALKDMHSKVKNLPKTKSFTLTQIEDLTKDYEWCKIDYERLSGEIVFYGPFPEGNGLIYFFLHVFSKKRANKYYFSRLELDRKFEECIKIHEQRRKAAADLFENYEVALNCKKQYEDLSYKYGEFFEIFIKP